MKALLLILMVFYLNSASAEILMNGKFSESGLSEYRSLQTNGKTYSGQNIASELENQVIFVDGYKDNSDQVALFNIHRSDAPTWKGIRTELVAINSDKNTEYWYGFGVLVPERITTKEWHVTLFQIHDSPDSYESGARHPTLSMVVDATSIRIFNSYDSDLITTPPEITPIPNVDYSYREIAKWEFAPDQWNYMIIRANWASDDTGFIDIWRNGSLIFSEENHPNTYNDELGVYAKLGIYTPGNEQDWSVLSAYHTGLIIGDKDEDLSKMQAALVPEPNIYMLLLSGVGMLSLLSPIFRKSMLHF